MWKTSCDAVKDLHSFNYFGGKDEEELKKAFNYSKELQSVKFIDPRTGDDLLNERTSTSRESLKRKPSRGRGRIIEECQNQAKLQGQLRMARPIGFGNKMIESYFTNNEEIDSFKNTLVVKEELKVPEETKKLEKTICIKTRRKSGATNVLMSTILKKCKENESLLEQTNEEYQYKSDLINWPRLEGHR